MACELRAQKRKDTNNNVKRLWLSKPSDIFVSQMATALPTCHKKLQALQRHVNAKIRALQLSPP